jgi:NAD(P)-dependent dehydrogenase (short-subunit alcohol dehydrogenase family)
LADTEQGGTSGIGAAITAELASRGAQIVLLTRYPASDPFLVEYVQDIRARTGNDLVYAEHVDLSSLHSIRLFATRWIDNFPPRRLDMIILCAATSNHRRPHGEPAVTKDGLEECWGVNYIANFHLLGILSPAVRVQPAHRDVRVILATCGTYSQASLRETQNGAHPLPQGKEYCTSKLALMAFAMAFQRHLDAYKRPDMLRNNSRVILVDPGLCRTPGTRRWLSFGTLAGLLSYVILWPLVWLLFKSPQQGAQSFLYASMAMDLAQGTGGKLIKECKETKITRKEVYDESVTRKLWEFSERQIISLESHAAKGRMSNMRTDNRAQRRDA